MAEQKVKNFGLKKGIRLELLSEYQVFLFSGILSKIDEDAIWVANAAGGDVPPIIYNSIETTVTRLTDDPEETDDAYRPAAQAERCKVLNISGGGLLFCSDRRFLQFLRIAFTWRRSSLYP